MKPIFVLGLFCLQSLYADASLDRYFSYMQQLGQTNGDFKQGEIEVVTNPEEIAQVQKIQEGRLLKKGFSAADASEFSRIGIVNEDQYWIWLRDAVYFPKGIPGTYDRLLWKSELQGKSVGVAVLPVLPSGQIILVLNFRHATRSWELELPRGGVQPGETQKEAALRELKEETGLIASSLDFLGDIAMDTGVLSSVTPVFLGKITSQDSSSIDYSEAIADTICLTQEEINEGLARGFLEISIKDEKKQVPLRDAFLTFALLQAQIRQLL